MARCSTALSGDEYAGNDVSTALVWAIFHDVGLTEIVAPADTVDSGAIVRPRVNVWNYGSQTEARHRLDAYSRRGVLPQHARVGSIPPGNVPSTSPPGFRSWWEATWSVVRCRWPATR